MKKFILILILLGAVTYIGMNIYTNNIDTSSQAAQALSGSPTGLQITLESKKVGLEDKKAYSYIYADFKVKADQKTMVTFLAPKLLKDGQAFNVATSAYRIDVSPIVRRFLGSGPAKAVKGPTVEFKKGKNSYRVFVVVNKAALPVGTYQMTFGDYTVGNSTTTYSLNTPWAKTFTVTNSVSTFLNGLSYRLTNINGSAVQQSTTTPILAFKDGIVRARFCNLIEGSYSIKNEELTITNLVGTKMACADNILNTVENNFGTMTKDTILITTVGDSLKLTAKRNKYSLTFTKYTPSTLAATAIPKVYPCNFVGPIEENAIRDCSGTLGTNLPPTITAVSTSSTRIGQTVTLTGTNFAASNNIVLMDNLTDDFTSALPVATVTPTGNTISFVIPSTHSCPQIDPTMTISCNQRPITSGVHSVQVKTTVGTSNSLSFVINP